MNTSSSSIETAFSRAAESYNGLATVQRTCAEKVLHLLSPSAEPLEICELGCGTGFLSLGLLERFPQAKLTAIDISGNMLAIAERLCGHEERVNWVESDVREYDFPKPLDCVFASSSLQWMEPLPELFPRIHQALKPEGRFSFLMMLKDTFVELHELRRELFPNKLPFSTFREESEIENLLQQSHFKIKHAETFLLERRAPSGWELLRTLSRSGLTRGPVSRGDALLSRTELIQLAEEYSARYPAEEGGVRASYSVGLFDAQPISVLS